MSETKLFAERNIITQTLDVFDVRYSHIVLPDGTPSHLSCLNIMDVDYVFGVAESTGGRLWVVGKDPLLFDYFLDTSGNVVRDGTGMPEVRICNFELMKRI